MIGASVLPHLHECCLVVIIAVNLILVLFSLVTCYLTLLFGSFCELLHNKSLLLLAFYIFLIFVVNKLCWCASIGRMAEGQ